MGVLRLIPVLMLVLILALLSGCGPPPSSDLSDTALKVNEVTISVEDFNEQIKRQAYSDPEMTLSRESRRQFVDYLIRKELMIQEAIRLKMERRKAFVKSIETYWESTLIRELLDYKTAEFRKEILIKEEEISAYYDRNKEQFDQPYAAVREHIRDLLEARRIEAALESWSRGFGPMPACLSPLLWAWKKNERGVV